MTEAYNPDNMTNSTSIGPFTLYCNPLARHKKDIPQKGIKAGDPNYEADERNLVYPYKRHILSAQDMIEAARMSHIFWEREDNSRQSGKKFIRSDVVYADVDNGGTVGEVSRRLNESGISSYLVSSKSHQIQKDGQTADRFHVYSPLKEPIDDPKQYTDALICFHSIIGVADRNARDAGRFFHGHDTPLVLERTLGEAFDGIGATLKVRSLPESLPEGLSHDKAPVILPLPRSKAEFGRRFGAGESHGFFLSLGHLSVKRSWDDNKAEEEFQKYAAYRDDRGGEGEDHRLTFENGRTWMTDKRSERLEKSLSEKVLRNYGIERGEDGTFNKVALSTPTDAMKEAAKGFYKLKIGQDGDSSLMYAFKSGRVSPPVSDWPELVAAIGREGWKIDVDRKGYSLPVKSLYTHVKDLCITKEAVSCVPEFPSDDATLFYPSLDVYREGRKAQGVPSMNDPANNGALASFVKVFTLEHPVDNPRKYLHHLTLFILGLFTGRPFDGERPLLAVTAPGPGAGKTKMVQDITRILTGLDPIEMGKSGGFESDSAKIQGRSTFSSKVILFDNVTNMKSAERSSLANMITSRRRNSWVMGKSRDNILNTFTYVATFNSTESFDQDIQTRSNILKMASRQQTGTEGRLRYNAEIDEWRKPERRLSLIENILWIMSISQGMEVPLGVKCTPGERFNRFYDRLFPALSLVFPEDTHFDFSHNEDEAMDDTAVMLDEIVDRIFEGYESSQPKKRPSVPETSTLYLASDGPGDSQVEVYYSLIGIYEAFKHQEQDYIYQRFKEKPPSLTRVLEAEKEAVGFTFERKQIRLGGRGSKKKTFYRLAIERSEWDSLCGREPPGKIPEAEITPIDRVGEKTLEKAHKVNTTRPEKKPPVQAEPPLVKPSLDVQKKLSSWENRPQCTWEKKPPD